MFCQQQHRVWWLTPLLLISLLLLSACGGGGSNSAPSDTGNSGNSTSNNSDKNTNNSNNELPPAPARITNTRGALLDGELLYTHSTQAISEAVANPVAKAPPVMPIYDVDNYRLTYQTVDGEGRLTTASGVVVVPKKPQGFRSPLLSFQHGTIFYDREAPSNDKAATAPPSIIASQGYIVLAADYIGYGASLGTDHPYLRADASAASVIDFIVAARQWLAEQAIPTNEQLFLTGYSEGGYVTLVAQRELERQGTPLTAVVAGAGPYDLQYTLDTLLNTKAVLSALGGSVSKWLSSFRPATDYAAKYPGKIDEARVDTLLYFLIPQDSDVEFDKTFLMDWMAEDADALRANSVYDWQALSPTRLTHGRDDATVPFDNSNRALNAMRKRGTQDIELVECIAQPADHTNCIPPYGAALVTYFSSFANDL